MWQALRELFEALLTALASFYAGTLLQKNREFENELRAIERGNNAGRVVDGLDDDGVMRELEQRGMRRVRDEPADDS